MNPMVAYLIEKLSEEKPPEIEDIEHKIEVLKEKKELKNLKEVAKKVEPESEKAKRIAEIAGRPWTPGQYGRGAAIGAAIQNLGGYASDAMIGEKTPALHEIFRKGQRAHGWRQTAARTLMGSLYGAAIPALKRQIDVEAAKRGKY
jgi:hypothetical protein